MAKKTLSNRIALIFGVGASCAGSTDGVPHPPSASPNKP